MVIFGAAVDITKRLVTPALLNLMTAGLLPENFALIGVDVADLTTDEWRKGLWDMIHGSVAAGGEFQPESIDADAWNFLLARMIYLGGDFGDEATFTKLGELLNAAEHDHHTGGNVAREAWTVKFEPTIVARFSDADLDQAEKIVGVSDDYDLVAGCEADVSDVLGEHASAKRSQPYGFSAAMGDAGDEVKSQASAVTGDCNDEGFAKAVERYILSGSDR
jgi:hypothetical protein